MQKIHSDIAKSTIVVLLFAFAFLSGIFQISDYDFWYHLKSGQFILSGKSFPEHDPFYYSLTKEPFTKDYWLFQIILYCIYALSGFKGIIIFQALCLFFTVLFIYKASRMVTPSLIIIVPVILCVIIGIKKRFVPRPELLVILFIAIYLFVIYAFLKKDMRWIFLIPAIHILWLNSHPSYVLGLAILFIYGTGNFVNNFISSRKEPMPKTIDTKTRSLFITFFITIICSFLSPSSFYMITKPFTWALSSRNEPLLQVIQELRSYSFKYDLFSFFSYLWLFAALALLLRIKKPDYSELFLFIFFSYLAFSAMRFMPYFVLIAGPVICSNLEYLRITFAKNKFAFNTAFTFALYLVLIALILYTAYSTILFTPKPNLDFTFGFGIAQNRFPVHLTDFIEKYYVVGKMYNPFHYGGYLEWRLFPQQKVFIDGRLPGGASFRNEYYSMQYNETQWQEALKKYDFDYVIVEYPPRDAKNQVASFMKSNNNYALVYFDDHTILFLKNIPQYAHLIQNFALHYVSPFPDVMGQSMHEIETNSETKNSAKNELLRLLALNENCALTHFYLGNIDIIEKQYHDAMNEFRKVLQIDPVIAGAHHNIGFMQFQDGKYPQAVEELNLELQISPDSIQTRILLARIYMMIGQYDKSRQQCDYILKKEPQNPEAVEMLNSLKK